MLTRNKINFIISLQKKKVRDENLLYIIEGDKMVREYIAAGMAVKSVIAKPEFLNSLSGNIPEQIETEAVSYEDLKRISTLKTPHNALALVDIPQKEVSVKMILKDWSLALDCIQDPGNLGTILRAAGWFGIKNIVCSEDCVDAYNPKVVQASMGALIHINVTCHPLIDFLSEASEAQVPVYGTLLNGESIFKETFEKSGIILIGNESKGISDSLIPFISNKIMIPRSGDSKYGIDSLNAAMAASIVLSHVAGEGKLSGF
jgi:RNA methyltransferase, TrmH family